jgi:hypothetical protein
LHIVFSNHNLVSLAKRKDEAAVLAQDEILDQQSQTSPKEPSEHAEPLQKQVEHGRETITECYATAPRMLLNLLTASTLATDKGQHHRQAPCSVLRYCFFPLGVNQS